MALSLGVLVICLNEGVTGTEEIPEVPTKGAGVRAGIVPVLLLPGMGRRSMGN